MSAFILEAVLAGGNAVAIRFSNRELAPLWGATLRFTVAALVLVAVTLLLRQSVPKGRALVGAVLFGLLQFAGAFGLYYFALVEVHAGLGQTLLALVPLGTLMLAVVHGQERWTTAALAGAVIGVAGVTLMSASALQPVPLPSLLAVLGSVVCFAEALVLVRLFPPVPPVTMNAVGMAVSVPVLWIASLLAGESTGLPTRGETWVALAYVTVIGSVVVFLLHLFVLGQWKASRTAYVMVLIPVVTVALSAWLDDEPITAGLVVGGLLVLTGVYVGALRDALR